MINRSFFYKQIKKTLFANKVTLKQVTGLNAMLDYWEANYAAKDDRWLAYALGTAHHETDTTFGPIREYGLGKGKKYPPYYGRGLVQLTWDYNYKSMGQKLHVDLLDNPDLALKLENAVPIIFIGMTEGTFTGKSFKDYFNGAKDDWVNARAIINGSDKKYLVADYAHDYYAAISYTT
ncbi:MAG: Chitinase class [Hyphomicrobiales bacterium]|nr:Chitinase class [Hyphomicrobiales bacterium]